MKKYCQTKISLPKFFLNNSFSAPFSIFPRGNENKFLIGCEDGGVYQATRHGDKKGINKIYTQAPPSSQQPLQSFLNSASASNSAFSTSSSSKDGYGHYGPVLSLSEHKAPGAYDFSEYFLTASADWTIKLWSGKGISGGNFNDVKGKENSIQSGHSIHTFEYNQDYIYDIAWSPAHPAIFAAADGLGNLDLWNINVNSEKPVDNFEVRGGARAVSKIGWSTKGDLLV